MDLVPQISSPPLKSGQVIVMRSAKPYLATPGASKYSVLVDPQLQRAQLSRSSTANFKAAEPVLQTSMTKVAVLCVSGIAANINQRKFLLATSIELL
ncbi:hypothetical protein RND71_012520 [Anisodus tanguticus]|uniref:Uncharacterized protein n=1 Tax=Anisodus tanguticus TaxID=243964 RepID=A0AAE1SDE7_9SOLA|nr:hypothetical protein RND71_012520 [Anisodus tanguticus]